MLVWGCRGPWGGVGVGLERAPLGTVEVVGEGMGISKKGKLRV